MAYLVVLAFPPRITKIYMLLFIFVHNCCPTYTWMRNAWIVVCAHYNFCVFIKKLVLLYLGIAFWTCLLASDCSCCLYLLCIRIYDSIWLLLVSSLFTVTEFLLLKVNGFDCYHVYMAVSFLFVWSLPRIHHHRDMPHELDFVFLSAYLVSHLWMSFYIFLTNGRHSAVGRVAVVICVTVVAFLYGLCGSLSEWPCTLFTFGFSYTFYHVKFPGLLFRGLHCFLCYFGLYFFAQARTFSFVTLLVFLIVEHPLIILDIIALSSFMPLMNSSLSNLSYFWRLHSFSFTLKLPIHSSALSSLSLINLHYCNDIIVSCVAAWNFHLVFEIDLCCLCTYLALLFKGFSELETLFA